LIDGAAEERHGLHRVGGERDSADHVDDQGVHVGTDRANHLENGGDLFLGEVPLQVDHSGNANAAGELIDRVRRHAGAVGDDEDATAPARLLQVLLRAEEGEVEVVLLAPEDQRASPILGFCREKSFRERLVAEAGLGDAVVELAEQQRLDPGQILLRHPANRRPGADLLFVRGDPIFAGRAFGLAHAL